MAKTPSKAPAAGKGSVDEFLAKVAAAPSQGGAGSGRLVFAMDATLSREPTWDQACHIQGEMFADTAAIGGLDIQLIYFRGFGECRASRWVSAADELLRLMSAVRCRGGHTQIARVLRRAIKETRARKVDALVYVGDCVEEDVDGLCALAGELGLLGVPVFVFHEGREAGAARAFKEIARLAGGVYCAFDGSSANQLRRLLKAVAVYAAGGRRALEDYTSAGGEAKRLLGQLK